MQACIAGVVLLLLLMLALFSVSPAQTFTEKQLKYQRVRDAKRVSDADLKKRFESKQLNYPSKNLFIRIFKQENELELWARDKATDTFSLVKKYAVCAMSGEPGPKRYEGDLQVPEGFYNTIYYNPTSNFLLSMLIDYPNASDRILKTKPSAGGQICIHGNCVSIGCVAITDEQIYELYWACIQAHSNGQANIPVHIFPLRFNDAANYDKLKEQYADNKTMLDFWENIIKGFSYFEEKKKLPAVTVDSKGKYIFK